jgi:hypothetical protein
VELGGAPIRKVFMLRGRHQVAFEVMGLGFYVYDLDTRSTVIWEGISGAGSIGLQLGTRSLVMNSTYGGERVFVWSTEPVN